MNYLKYIIVMYLVWVNATAQEQFTVYFDFNQDMPNTTSAVAFDGWMIANKNIKVIAIHGFADAADNDDYNYNLSKKRIENIAALLRQNGVVLAEDVVQQPFGEAKASGNDEKDRRVVIWYVPQVIAKESAPVKEVPRQPLDASSFVKGNTIVLNGLLFYPDTDFIEKPTLGVLEELAEILRNNPSIKITIQGHMCCSAYDRTNLSGDRARKVYKELAARGISKKRMSHKGYGVTRPIYSIPEKNDEERLANRRVEVFVVED